MKLEVLAIEQSLSLDTMSSRHFVRMRLPTNEEMVFETSEANVVRLIESKELARLEKKAEDPEQVSEPDPYLQIYSGSELEVEQAEEAQDLVDWAALPDDILPPIVKAHFYSADLPPMMSAVELARMTHDILATLSTQPSSAPTPVTEPPIGVVERGVRPPTMMRPIRTVPSDEQGYPIAQDRNVSAPTAYTDDDTGVPSV